MLSRSFKISLPILVGYLPWGIAFGLLFQSLGLPWYFATLNAVIIYAGAAQFVSVTLLAAGAPLSVFFMAALVINFRHLFYSFSFIPKYAEARPWQRFLLAGTLTDETYSLLGSQKLEDLAETEKCRLYLIVSLLNYGYWVLGCTLGACLATLFHLNIQGLDFITTAMFLVMTVEQWRQHKRWEPFVIAAVTTLIALIISQKQLLAIAMGLASFWVVIDYYRLAKRNTVQPGDL